MLGVPAQIWGYTLNMWFYNLIKNICPWCIKIMTYLPELRRILPSAWNRTRSLEIDIIVAKLVLVGILQKKNYKLHLKLYKDALNWSPHVHRKFTTSSPQAFWLFTVVNILPEQPILVLHVGPAPVFGVNTGNLRMPNISTDWAQNLGVIILDNWVTYYVDPGLTFKKN